jgi:hypothetical protein
MAVQGIEEDDEDWKTPQTYVFVVLTFVPLEPHAP